MEKLFSVKGENQKRIIQRLGFQKTNKQHYFARGHLNPNANQPLKTWSKATYHYINQVPQWQVFNNGLWKAVEGFVRDI